MENKEATESPAPIEDTNSTTTTIAEVAGQQDEDEEKMSTMMHKTGKVPPPGGGSGGDQENRIFKLDNNDVCLQLEDITYQRKSPIHLIKLFQYFDLNTMTNAEMLFLIVYLNGLEMGFAELSCYRSCNKLLHSDKYNVTSFFDAYNVYLLATQKKTCYKKTDTTFSLPLCNLLLDEDLYFLDFLTFNLTAIVTGDGMILTITTYQNALPQRTYPTRSLYLNILRYIVGKPKQENNNENSLQKHLNKMNELSFILRQELFVPMQQYFLALIEMQTFPSLIGLPSELYDNIFKYLSANQLRIVANVNKQLLNLVKQSKYYKKKVIRQQQQQQQQCYETAFNDNDWYYILD